jgi:hypothetical protein
MATSDFFRPDDRSAREAFLAAARVAGARLSSQVLPDHRGPAGESLAIDAAALGPAEPESLLLLISGTHGVEGLAGSGCEVGVLLDELHGALPAGGGALLIQALNPHGFAWLRRGNEHNIDLNRNGLDFCGPLPENPAYDALHDALLPPITPIPPASSTAAAAPAGRCLPWRRSSPSTWARPAAAWR